MWNVVFMGTPDFAVGSLKALLEAGQYHIQAVVTQPDRPKGRGQKMVETPVKTFALQHGLPVFQPLKVKEAEFVQQLKAWQPDFIVVAAFGQFLTQEILDIPIYGCINVHASLLPAYRGAAPIQWVILDGRKETGVTAMLMDVGLDTGDMLMKASLTIGENETAEELHDRLAALGAELIVQTVHAAAEGRLQPEKQDDSQSCYAAMLTKELSPIDFTKTAQQVHDKVRGLNSWPSASAVLNGKRLKIHRTIITEGHGEPGQVLSLQPLVVACGEGAVEIIEVQPEGKKKMSAQSYLNGLHGLSADELRFS